MIQKLERQLKNLLESRFLWILARVLLAIIFVGGGMAKLIDFDGGVAEMTKAGLEPAALYNGVVAVTLLTGSALLFAGRWVWLGAGMLGVFLFLTIIIVHRFWALPEPQAQLAMFWALEHLAVIGGLMAAAIAGHFHALMDHAWRKDK